MGPNFKRLLALVPVVVFAIAIWLLYHEISHYRRDYIEQSLSSIPSQRIVVAVGLAVFNFVVLIGYDWLALNGSCLSTR